MATYQEALQVIYGYIRYSQTLDKQRVSRSREVLRRIGDPQAQVPVIHVTGTKGKGSVCAMLAAVLRANGRRVGLYTSPHLHTLRERIQINGHPIDQADFAALVDHLRPTFEAVPGVGFPEVMTALAFHYFAAQHVDIAVIEVHVGGRYDATNVITPLCSVVNMIDYDHTDLLGPTLAQIAHHKAGIIKPDVPVICGPQPAEALAVLREQATAQTAPMTLIGQDVSIMTEPPTMVGQSVWVDGEQYTTNLCGTHQGVNLALAVMTLQTLAPLLSLHTLRAGLMHIHWPGRLEYVRHNATAYLLDIAHNPAAAASLRAYRDAVFPGEPWTFVFGAKANKDANKILRTITHTEDRLILTQVQQPQTATPAQLAALLDAYGHLRLASVRQIPQLPQAIATTSARPDEMLVCVTGSIFVVAAARAYILGLPAEPGSAH
jgi:dihydrofolate synthase / folylpolyglutamate synthase